MEDHIKALIWDEEDKAGVARGTWGHLVPIIMQLIQMFLGGGGAQAALAGVNWAALIPIFIKFVQDVISVLVTPTPPPASVLKKS